MYCKIIFKLDVRPDVRADVRHQLRTNRIMKTVPTFFRYRTVTIGMVEYIFFLKYATLLINIRNVEYYQRIKSQLGILEEF